MNENLIDNGNAGVMVAKTTPPPEYFDVLDENGEKTGKVKLRQAVHRDGDWHRSVDIFVVNGDKVLLQKRCKTKDSYPDMWDLSCGGHIAAGESSLETAVGELGEELGLRVKGSDLEFIESFKSSARPAVDFINNSFNDMYILRTNAELDEMKFQEEEISALKYVPIAEFYEMVSRGAEDLVPHRQMYGKFFEVLGPTYFPLTSV